MRCLDLIRQFELLISPLFASRLDGRALLRQLRLEMFATTRSLGREEIEASNRSVDESESWRAVQALRDD